MTMSQHVGDQLRERRSRFGFSVDDVARLARLPTDRLVAIESGATPTTFELARLAGALAVDPAALVAGAAVEDDPRRSVARFRRNEAQDRIAPEDVRLLSRAAEIGRIGEFLRRLLGHPESPVRRSRGVRPVESAHPGREGYTLGQAARLALADDRRPIPSVQEWLEFHGVHVALVEFESTDIEAASLYEEGSIPVILLNRANRRARLPLSRRAVLAHELCHLLHDGGSRELVTVVSRDSTNDPVEQRANGFAPSFLAPRPWVQFEALPSDPDEAVVALAQTWGLSYEGAVYHGKNIALFDHDVAKVLLTRPRKITTDFEGPLPRREAPDELAPTPLVEGLISDWAIAAHENDLISLGRLREILEAT